MLLYDNYLIFCRVSEAGASDRVSSRVSYQYKFSLPVSNVSMITDLDGEEDLEGEDEGEEEDEGEGEAHEDDE